MDANRRCVLRANHQLIINSLELTNTHVLDKLQEDGTISSGESEEILTNKTKREQNAKLLFILKRRSCKGKDPYLSFLNALSDEYDFISEKLKREEAISGHLVKQHYSDGFICFHCKLLKNIRAKDLTHQLFEEEVISDDDLDIINSENTCRQHGVKKLLEVLGRSRLPQNTVIEKLLTSLKQKYNHIVAGYILNQKTVYSCCCRQKRKVLIIKPLDIGYPSNQNNKDKYSILPVSSDYSGSVVNKTDNDTDDEDITLGEILHPCHEARKFCITKTIWSDETRKMDVVKYVYKSFPNDKKLMRLCSKLWNKLFTLREKGDWDLFHSVTQAARNKFKDNPDVQVLLYRSDMCISSFYNDSRAEALDNFKKASDLISSTAMPDWHLARLLPLKVELLTRSKEFDDASSLLKEAHQAMSNLEPCLSTGAVHFFEAIYLGAVLRCTPGGTRSTSIRQRAKECFLTAITHYEQEKLFEVKSFLNQVYLFLALFALGVDIKQNEYLHINNISTDDIALAEYYLNLYENNCWNESTNWSRMLFFIARAEQHKQRQSLLRSSDYLNDALTCAVKGGYNKQKIFIEHNIRLLESTLKEQYRIQAITQHEMSVNEILANLEDSSSDSC